MMLVIYYRLEKFEFIKKFLLFYIYRFCVGYVFVLLDKYYVFFLDQ